MRQCILFILALIAWLPAAIFADAIQTNRPIFLHRSQFHQIEVSEERKEAQERDKDFVDWVARSQFENARFLLKHPGAVVMLEGSALHTHQEYLSPDQETAERIEFTKSIFPQGMPTHFEDLTLIQKEVLIEFDGPMVLYFLGDINEIQPAAIPEESAPVRARMAEIKRRNPNYDKDPEYDRLRMHEREKLAISKFKSEVAKPENYGKEFIVFYGDAHDFASHKNEFPEIEFARSDAPNLSRDPSDPSFWEERMNSVFAESQAKIISQPAEFEIEFSDRMRLLGMEMGGYLAGVSKAPINKLPEPEILKLLSWGSYVAEDLNRTESKLKAVKSKSAETLRLKSEYLTELSKMRASLGTAQNNLNQWLKSQQSIEANAVVETEPVVNESEEEVEAFAAEAETFKTNLREHNFFKTNDEILNVASELIKKYVALKSKMGSEVSGQLDTRLDEVWNSVQVEIKNASSVSNEAPPENKAAKTMRISDIFGAQTATESSGIETNVSPNLANRRDDSGAKKCLTCAD